MKTRSVLALGAVMLLVFALGEPAGTTEPEGSSLFGPVVEYFLRVQPFAFQVLGRVKQVEGDRLSASMESDRLKTGRELLVLSRKGDAPPYLLKEAAVVRVVAFLKDRVVLRRVASLGKPVQPGDPIVFPASPVVYLQSGIPGREHFAPYGELLRDLLAARLRVMEVPPGPVQPEAKGYGVLVRMDAEGGFATVKIRSLYSGETFLTWTVAVSPQGAQSVSPPPAGKSVRPAAPPAAAAPSRPAAAGPRPVEPVTLRLKEHYFRLVVCDLAGDGIPDYVLLNNKGVFAYRAREGRLLPFAHYRFPGSAFIGIHLHAADIDGDHRDELLVTLGRKNSAYDYDDTDLASLVLAYRDRTLQPLRKDLPYYLRVLRETSGKPVILAQAKGTYQSYGGPVLRLVWNTATGRFDPPKPYDPARNVASLYQFNILPAFPGRLMILEPNHRVDVYRAATQQVEAVSDANFGPFQEIPFRIRPQRIAFSGGFDREPRIVYAPRRFMRVPWEGNRVYTIKKGRRPRSIYSTLRTLIASDSGEDRLVALTYSQGKRIVEAWSSKGIAKDILDFAIFGPKNAQRRCLLVRDTLGYAVMDAR